MNTPHPRVTAATKAMRKLAITFPEFLIPFAKVRELMIADDTCATAQCDTRGRITLGRICDALTREQLATEVCHELLHLALKHHTRFTGARGYADSDHALRNIAADMLINTSLRDAGLACPPHWTLYVPPDYSGERTVEALFAWLKRQKDAGNNRAPDADGSSGNGCAPVPAPNAGNAEQDPNALESIGSDMIATIRALGKASGQGEHQGGQLAGRGSGALLQLLIPPPAKHTWKQVLRHSAERAVSGTVRDVRSYARLTRRPMAGIMHPGLIARDCAVAVIVDVSGSMSREIVAQIHAECAKIVSAIPSLKVFLVSHTDRVEWKGWVKSGGKLNADLSAATSFSGGTDATEAYNAVRTAGQFDTIVHFTDAFLGHTWPDVPSRTKLIIGLCGEGGRSYCPPRAEIISIER